MQYGDTRGRFCSSHIRSKNAEENREGRWERNREDAEKKTSNRLSGNLRGLKADPDAEQKERGVQTWVLANSQGSQQQNGGREEIF